MPRGKNHATSTFWWGQGPFSNNFFFTEMFFKLFFYMDKNQNWPKLQGQKSYLSLYYSIFFQLFWSLFCMSIMRNNFIKLLIIFFNKKLTTFLNMCENVNYLDYLLINPGLYAFVMWIVRFLPTWWSIDSSLTLLISFFIIKLIL